MTHFPVHVTTAFLASEGLNDRRATLHKYSHSEPVTLPNGLTGLAHYFRCTETGELRRWGFDATFAKDTGGN